MNDAERDAWLREALRHAPDSDAVPPSGVSEAILLKARAAARGAAPALRRGGSRAAPSNPFAAFWAWLARPPVAAGFASVMAATLVGLMWWDRPMDETMPRPPAISSERADAAPPLTSTAPAPAAAPQAAPIDALKAAAPRADLANATKAQPPGRGEAATNAAPDDADARRRQRSGPAPAAAGDAKVAESAAGPAKRKVDALAKERAPAAEPKNESPAPFPSTEEQRETPTAAARKSLDAPTLDAAKKNDEALRSRAAGTVDRAAAPTAQSVAPAPAAPAVAAAPAPTPPLASGRVAADEARPSAAMQSESSMAKSAAGAAPAAPTAKATATPPREVAATPFGERAQRQRSVGDLRDKDAAGVASPPPSALSAAPFRNELDRARTEAAKPVDALTRAEPTPRLDAFARSAPLARVLAAIAADPERWSRQAAGGETVALDAGWRSWLGELDAAAAGRWRLLAIVGAAADVDAGAARDGATTLRLVNAGRVAAVVRIDGATVQVDAAPGTGADRWQATLAPAGAERLRTLARRLSP